MEVMRRVLLCDGGDGGDALCAALYIGGCGGWDRFARGDAVHVILHAGGCGVFEICRT